jgi:hypothetical protein
VSGDSSSTLTTEAFPRGRDEDPDGPGVVMIFSVNRPTLTALPLLSDPIVIGRRTKAGICIPLDSRMSRTHAKIRAIGDRLEVADLQSHNGTFVDGIRVTETVFSQLPRALRIGDTVFIFVPRIGPFLGRGVDIDDGVVVGPVLALVREKLAAIAGAGGNVLLTGPTGVGKELAARHFHASGRHPSGPLVPVNCATIPPAIAERLLFGAQRGAYSGADANVDGYVQAAHGGTLFLDEIAELEPAVQAKLLRVVETKEVLPLGATRARKVDFQLCGATLKDLRAEVAAGRFREDLYHRVGRPEVRIPSLRERAEEIPWLAATELRRLDERFAPTASLMEACLLRDWPGNVREFLREMQEAAMSANADARTLLHATDLPTLDVADASDHSSPEERAAARSQEQILDALRDEGGNVSRAARKLGMHRNQLRRWLAAQGFDVSNFRDRTEPPPSLQTTVEARPGGHRDSDQD